MSGQDRCAMASNRCATARVQVTETASGLNTGLPKRRAGLSAADSSEPTGTAAFRRSNWDSVKTISINHRHRGRAMGTITPSAGPTPAAWLAPGAMALSAVLDYHPPL